MNYRIASILLVPIIAISWHTEIDYTSHEISSSIRFRESVNSSGIPRTGVTKAIEGHKYYVSVSNVKYSEKAKALQMITRFFIDDFEDVLIARNDQKITLGNKEQLDEQLPMFKKYIENKLKATINNKNSLPDLIGAEYVDDQILLYIELPVSERPKCIELSFLALMEVFPDQKNLIHFKIDDQRRTIIIDANRRKGSLKF